MELYGRNPIYTDAESITSENITDVLNAAIVTHELNRRAIKTLRDYYRGKQAIRGKTKATRPEINHIICENRAYQITDFWTGTLAGDPIVLTSRSGTEESTEAILSLNKMLSYEDIDYINKRLFDDMHICGTAYLGIFPDVYADEAPFELYILEPENTFVVYSAKVGHKPIMAVHFSEGQLNSRTYEAYTEDAYYKLDSDGAVIDKKPYALGIIPIIEFNSNSARLGVFEPVIDLLDAVNYCDSDRLDAITQFVNSLVVLYNAQLPEGEDGNSIREQGLICLKAIGENKADIKILAEQLDQTQNQTLKDDMINSIFAIVGMPSMNNGSASDSSNNGAALIRSGYPITETRAKNEEKYYKRSAKKALELILRICADLSDLRIALSDIDIVFTRHIYSDIGSKATVLTQLLGSDKVAPIDAWTLSTITSEPEEATKRGLEWYEKNKNATPEENAVIEDIAEVEDGNIT